LKLFAVTFALAAACATTTPKTAAAPARDCGKLVAAIAAPGSAVTVGPDGNTKAIATFADKTPVCVSSEPHGFGFRTIQLEDGRTGYIAEGALLP
jgi:hypothetical protein